MRCKHGFQPDGRMLERARGLKDLPHAGFLAEGQKWDRILLTSRQGIARLPRWIGDRDGQKLVGSKADRQKLLCGQARHGSRMVMAQQELSLTLQHDAFTRLHVVGNELNGTKTDVGFQGPEPIWKEGE